MKRLMSATLVLLAGMASAQAQEFTGGYLGTTYSGMMGALSPLDKLVVEGGGEIALNRDVSVQADLAFSNFGWSDLNGTTLNLHGIYHASPTTSLGLFAGRDKLSVLGYSDTVNFYGAEIGHQQGRVGGEAYALRAKGENIVGLSGFYELENTAKIGARFDSVSLTDHDLDIDLDADVMALTASYRLAPSFDLSAELGRMKVSETDLGSDSNGFVSLSATYVFGNGRGTTFNARSILNMLPGL